MKRLFLLAFAMFLPAVFPVRAESPWDETQSETLALPVVLREKAVIKSDKIRLGDLFSGLPRDKENRVVADAPSLGKDVVLTADWLKKAAQKHAVDWEPADSGVTVEVKRAAREIGKADVLPALVKELKTLGLSDNAEIALNGKNFPILAPADSEYDLSFEDIDFSPGAAVFSAKAVVKTDEETQTVDLKGKVQVFVFLPTARHACNGIGCVHEKNAARTGAPPKKHAAVGTGRQRNQTNGSRRTGSGRFGRSHPPHDYQRKSSNFKLHQRRHHAQRAGESVGKRRIGRYGARDEYAKQISCYRHGHKPRHRRHQREE